MQTHTCAITDVELRRHFGNEIRCARAVLLRLGSNQDQIWRADELAEAIDERLVDTIVTVARLTHVGYIHCPSPGRYQDINAKSLRRAG